MDFSQPLDELTLAALRKRCRRTQERVYRDYSSAAWTLGLRLSGCEAQAWDAVQAGFVKAFERISQLRNPAAFGPWLRRLIVNQVMDQHRCSLEGLPPGFEAVAEDSALDHGLDLEQALNKLEVPDRSVLWLHDVEGLTHAEIADLAGQTVSWSKSRLSRARAKIRKWLDAYRPEPREHEVITDEAV
ncbi:MAG: sigma-70 family RNA polymerase sigma factor [Wenzhouxiangella sp.]|jgi:RNA polymerase sigma-70 factor (ECF subfamily)|nr:sigma-70 family RNA polymerase sigma factor [Wenzhouxiangella sp.]